MFNSKSNNIDELITVTFSRMMPRRRFKAVTTAVKERSHNQAADKLRNLGKVWAFE